MNKKHILFYIIIALAAAFSGCAKKEAVSYDAGDIYQVAAYGNAKAVEKAVKDGASVNARDTDGFTPLFYAVLGEPKRYADALTGVVDALKADDDDALYASLTAAPATKGNAEVVKALLANGANIALTDRAGRSAFLYAALFCSDTAVLQALLDGGADTTETITVTAPQTLMAFASFTNMSPDVVSFLAQKTGGVNEPNTKGTTPIMWAAMYSPSPAVIDALVKEGADINDSRHSANRSPLDWALLCNKEQSVIEHIRDIGGVSFKPKYSAGDVGKIILSDGRLVPLSGYDKSSYDAVAVIISVTDGGKRALGMGLESESLAWAPRGSYGLTGRIRGLEGLTDGSRAWAAVQAADPSGAQDAEKNYPAFNFANTYGRKHRLANFADGWYLPTEKELDLIDVNKHLNATSAQNEVNKVLDAFGIDSVLWCSSVSWIRNDYYDDAYGGWVTDDAGHNEYFTYANRLIRDAFIIRAFRSNADKNAVCAVRVFD